MTTFTRWNPSGRRLAAAIAIAAAALVAVPMTDVLAQSTRIARADTRFMEQAAQSGHAEIQSSQLALDKAGDPRVREFAQQMVDDHNRIDEELRALARVKGADLPDSASLIQKGKTKLLSMSEGENFDKGYLQSMGVTAHRDLLELFSKHAVDAQDPDIKAFASKQLTTLQHHLDMALQLVSALDATDAAPPSGSTGMTPSGRANQESR